MIKKYIGKIKREILKKDAREFKRIMKKYNLDLFFEDKNSIVSQISIKENFMHILKEKTCLDGKVAEIINSYKTGSNEIAIDIGANFGVTSIIMSKYFKKVFSFEPVSENIHTLRKNIKANSCFNIELIEKAVSNIDGELPLFISGAAGHHSLGIAHENMSEKNKITIPSIKLDTFCKNNLISKIDLLKVDVEGFEPEVFEGANNLLLEKKIGTIIFELSEGVIKRLNRDILEVPLILEKYGYKIFNFEGKEVSLSQIGQSEVLNQDLFARANGV